MTFQLMDPRALIFNMCIPCEKSFSNIHYMSLILTFDLFLIKLQNLTLVNCMCSGEGGGSFLCNTTVMSKPSDV